MAVELTLLVHVLSNDDRPENEVKDRLEEMVQRSLGCVLPPKNLYIERVEKAPA